MFLKKHTKRNEKSINLLIWLMLDEIIKQQTVKYKRTVSKSAVDRHKKVFLRGRPTEERDSGPIGHKLRTLGKNGSTSCRCRGGAR